MYTCTHFSQQYTRSISDLSLPHSHTLHPSRAHTLHLSVIGKMAFKHLANLPTHTDTGFLSAGHVPILCCEQHILHQSGERSWFKFSKRISLHVYRP